jgi:membrane AbrB-like protein
MDTILFLLFAYIGGKLGIKLKLPAGALLGAMLFVGLFKVLEIVQFNHVSPLLRVGAQIALGTMIGLMFTKEILMLPLSRLLGFILLGLGGVLTAITLSLVFNWFNLLPFITGIMALAPGGIAEMLTLSESLDSNTQAVAIMHTIRFVFIMLTFKWILNLIRKRSEKLKA